MRNTRTNKGITLIALVITIIVLLILAAVSIATLTGENGILTKANTAKNQTIEAEEKEQINLAYTTVMAEKLHNSRGNDLTVSAEELGAELGKQKANATAEVEGDKIKVTFNKSGNEYTVNGGTGEITSSGNSGGQTEIPTISMENAKEQDKFEIKTKVEDTNKGKFIVPAGFKIASDSADLVEDGIVIEDTTGNQFVWVPVEDIANFRTIEGYSNGLLESYLDYSTEPFTSGYSTEQAEYNAMKKSVKDNQGFYIGRFEAGKDSSGNVVVKKGANVYNDVPWGNAMNDIEGTSNTGGKVGAVKLSRDFAMNNNYQGVTSTLCYGVQWDATMQFMDNKYISGTCDAGSYVRDSTGRGHYIASSPTTTGSKPEYAEKNIYDMAGNVGEWTMEAFDIDMRIPRGGAYNCYGQEYTASKRSKAPPDYCDDEDDTIGFRFALYLQS